MSDGFFKILSYISAGSVVLPIFISILNFKTLSRSLRVLFVYLLVCSLSDIAGLTMIVKRINNNFVFNFFTILESSLIIYIYFLEAEQKQTKKIIYCIGILFACVASAVFYYKGINSLDQIVSTVENLLVISLAVAYFYKLLLNLKIKKIEGFYFYWINTAFLIYFCMSFFLFLGADVVTRTETDIAYLLWTLHLIIYIVYNILFSIGISKAKWKANYL